MLENLGKDLDIVAGIYPSTRWKRRCQILPLTEIPLCCAVSRQNPLSSRKKLRLPDLYGENLLMVERGDTKFIDALRDEIEKIIRRSTFRMLHLMAPEYSISATGPTVSWSRSEPGQSFTHR